MATYAPSTLKDDLQKSYENPAGSPEERVRHWQQELDHASKTLEDFHKLAREAVRRYLDDDRSADTQYTTPRRLPLFHSNIVTLQASLYAKIPKAEADRRFFDPADDVARVASEMISRIINNDLNNPKDNSHDVLKAVLQDNLIGGLGVARFKYKPVLEANPEYNEEAPVEGVESEIKTDEQCEPVYTYWEDVLWSPCRVWSECRWIAFRAYMTKEQVEARFGEEVAKNIPYVRKGDKAASATDLTGEVTRTVPEAEVWEIWNKEDRTTCWYVKGYYTLLDEKEDMLGIPEFLPTPAPFANNLTTTKYIPRPDYALHKHLYQEIDELETRIAYLTNATKAVGVYDASSKAIGRVLSESCENEMIPVENWAMFAQNGGMKGVVDWVPVEAIARSLEICVSQQALRIQQLYQVSGMSDIIRGQATDTAATATEQRIKAQFASTRIQSIQERFADYVTDLMNIKVGIIRKHYDPQKIIALSNIMATPDAPLALQAIELIKNPEQFNIRVAIRSESMAQERLDALREERVAVIQGMAQFLGMAQPYAQQMPESVPFLLQLMQFGMAGFKGANEMEGVIDQAIESVKKTLAEKAQQPPPPSPEEQKIKGQMQIEQMKAQMEAQSKQQDQQLEAQKLQMEMQMEQQKFQLEIQKMQMEMQQDAQKHELEMKKLQAQIQAQQVSASIKQDAEIQQAQIKQESARTDAEIRAESAATMADIAANAAKAKSKQAPAKKDK